jgi:hypothetical protein
MYLSDSWRISSRRQVQSAVVEMREPSSRVKGSGSIEFEVSVAGRVTGHEAPSSSAVAVKAALDRAGLVRGTRPWEPSATSAPAASVASAARRRGLRTRGSRRRIIAGALLSGWRGGKDDRDP